MNDTLNFHFKVLDVNAFERLLGPCKEVMERAIDNYAEEVANLNAQNETVYLSTYEIMYSVYLINISTKIQN